MLKNHHKRVEKVKKFAGKNKIFVITMIIAVIFLFYNIVFVNNENTGEIPQNQAEISEEVDEENAAPEESHETWRFYFIDVIVLVAGGGFCTVMILRQRRKTKEELK
jgi:heme/copper-type cytochrome/quinol oxidase subunit 3